MTTKFIPVSEELFSKVGSLAKAFTFMNYSEVIEHLIDCFNNSHSEESKPSETFLCANCDVIHGATVADLLDCRAATYKKMEELERKLEQSDRAARGWKSDALLYHKNAADWQKRAEAAS